MILDLTATPEGLGRSQFALYFGRIQPVSCPVWSGQWGPPVSTRGRVLAAGCHAGFDGAVPCRSSGYHTQEHHEYSNRDR